MNNHNDYEKLNSIDFKELPANWKVKRFKYLTKSRKELSKTGNEELLSVTEVRGIVKRRELKTNDENLSRSEDLTGYRHVKKGDLVSNIMLVWKRGLGVSPYNGIVSPAYSVFTFSNECNPDYYNYLVRSEEYITEFRKHSTGITMSRLRLYDDSFGAVFAHVPPIKEQKLISCYLDKKTMQIDRLVEQIQKKTELLKEQRISLINKSVTKGLDLTVEMKESGVEWIGKVPKHWKVKKIKHLSIVKRGSSPRPIDDPKYFDNNGEYSWVRISDVTASGKYLEETKEKLSELGSSLSTKIEKGDIFLSIAGSVGKPIITNIKCCIHDGFVWFEGLKVNVDFLFYVFLQGTCFQGLGKLGTQLNLNTDTVGDVYLPVPNHNEQKNIVKKLEKKLLQIQKCLDLETLRLKRLQEYRQSLISSVVTGKFRISEDMI